MESRHYFRTSSKMYKIKNIDLLPLEGLGGKVARGTQIEEDQSNNTIYAKRQKMSIFSVADIKIRTPCRTQILLPASAGKILIISAEISSYVS
jgi:hypothetical protein